MTSYPSLIDLTEEEQALGQQSRAESRGRRQVTLIVLGTILLLALGVWGNWPWLATEHARLEPAQQWLIWAADGMALLWTLWFGLWHGVLGKPLPTRPATDRTFWWVLLTLFAGMALDGAATAASAYHEETGNVRGVLAPQAFFTAGRTSRNGELAYVACRFQDQAGGWHESRLDVSLGLRPAFVAAVQGGQFPVAVQIKYDPQWPPRCWLSPDNVEHQPLYLFSISVLLFQAMLTIITTAFYWKWRASLGRMPIYKFVPIWAVMLPLCCAALGKLLTGEF